MPFGPYKDFDECMKKNKDKKSPGGYCSVIHKRVTDHWPGEKKYKKTSLKSIAESIRSLFE